MKGSQSDSQATSLVVKTLTKVLCTLLGDRAPLVISYRQRSGKLWSLWAFDNGELQTPLVEKAKNGLILVWDGSTSSSLHAGRIDTTEFLNPLTWSLCASHRFPNLRVAVVDCSAVTHARARFYRAVRLIDRAKLPFGLLEQPDRYLEDCLSFLQQEGHDARDAEAVRDVLIHQLRAMLTERGQESNRHALANIVGPQILMGRKLAKDNTPLQRELLLLFHEIGLLGKIEGKATEASPPRLFGDRRVRLLLVDDQFDQGWNDWVASMVVGESACLVETAKEPDVLVNAIRGSLNCGDADCRFRLNFPSLRIPDPPTQPSDTSGKARKFRTNLTSFADLAAKFWEVHPKEPESETILLLDLRLFSLRPVQDEAGFVRTELLPLCQRFVVNDVGLRSEIAWPGFSSSELKSAAEWCANPKRETDAYLNVLSLLPRLLALVDMSVPIVLFSSTGQRRVIELLQPYGNIVTDFEKPRFQGMEVAGLVAETEMRFREALARAANLLSARQQCRRIVLPEVGDGRVNSPAVSGAAHQPVTRYVELFLDERDWNSGDHFSLGGCFAVFEADDFLAACAKADRFDDWLVRRGVRYFDNRGVGVVPDDGSIRRKGSNLLPYIQECQKQPDAPIHLGLVRLRIQRNREQSPNGPLFDPVCADNRYHLALKAILELFLCESIPALAGRVSPEDVVVSVFPATRVVSISPKYQNHVMTKFGLKRLANTNLFFSFDRSQVYPVVADTLDAHAISRKTYRLVAVQLPYRGEHIDLPEFFRCRHCSKVVGVDRNCAEPPHAAMLCACTSPDWQPDYRALHYLADEVLTQFPDGEAAYQYDELFAGKLVPGEFDETLDEHLASSLAAGRCLDLGDMVGAVSRFNPVPEAKGKPRASFWLQKRLYASLPTMSGPEFLRLADDVVRQGREELAASTRMPFEDLKNRWRVRQYTNAQEYRASGATWHEEAGFHVRRSSTRRVTVFADLLRLGDRELPGFVEPFAKTLFLADGTPCGQPLDPRSLGVLKGGSNNVTDPGSTRREGRSIP